MPELPDITVYIDSLEKRILGEPVESIRLKSMFLLRTFEPRPLEVIGKRVREIRRMGKRIVLGLENDLFLVMHLMIAGRLQWKDKVKAPVSGISLAAFDFPKGTLIFTEASILSGIGNAYSDEILHRARMSPVTLTGKMDDAALVLLHAATIEVMQEWIDRLTKDVGDGWPVKVTAFRPEMAVHGRFGQPCPVCQSPVQHIVYADNETNYCATCQTGGKLLADRSLSKLMKADWPKTLAELEDRKRNKL